MADALGKSAAVSHGMMLSWAEDGKCPMCKHGEVVINDYSGIVDDEENEERKCECGCKFSVNREVRTVSIFVDGEEITDEFSKRASDFKRELEAVKVEHHKMREFVHQIVESTLDNMVNLRPEGTTVISVVNTQEVAREILDDLSDRKCDECGKWEESGQVSDENVCWECAPPEDADEPDKAELYSES